jgi:maleate cis-trans isomerase
VSSNQASLWACLRVLGVTDRITGFGRLLAGLAPGQAAA